MANGWSLLKDFNRLTKEQEEISNKLEKTNDPTERERLSEQLDGKLARIMNIKHALEGVYIWNQLS